jgi:hypothetical protein
MYLRIAVAVLLTLLNMLVQSRPSRRIAIRTTKLPIESKNISLQAKLVTPDTNKEGALPTIKILLKPIAYLIKYY